MGIPNRVWGGERSPSDWGKTEERVRGSASRCGGVKKVTLRSAFGVTAKC